ncbi:MAG: hypothetical protein ACOX5M_06865 [Bacillota bacterium]
MAELDDVKKAAIAAAISAYLASGASGTAAFRPTMFLRQVKGAGAWGRLSRSYFGTSGGYRTQCRGNRA